MLLLAAALTLLAGCGPVRIAKTVRLSMAGAQIPVELISSWAGDAKDYRFRITPVSPIYLSQHGFDALRRGECDVACTDRVIALRELEGFGDRKLVGYRIAYYGYGLYVNHDNTVDSIFAKHISMMFKKQITDWKQLGGPEIPIRLYGPKKGTRGGQLLSRQAGIWFDVPTWEAFDSPEEIVQHVADDPGGLGFAPIGYDHDTRYLGIRMTRGGPPAWPSIEEIEADKYGFAKLIYVYAFEPLGDDARMLIDYLQSADGVAAIESTRMHAIPPLRAVIRPVR